MHARHSRIKTPPDRVDQAKEVVEKSVVPRLHDVQGFAGGYWMIDRATGDGAVFTFFDSKQNLEASADTANRVRQDALREIGGEALGIEHYEVGRDTGQKIHRGASHARVVNIQGDPADADRGPQMIEERVIPALRNFPGFVGGFWLVDRDSGKGVGVTLFDSAENLSASRPQAEQLREGTRQQLKGTVGEFREYEIFARAEAPTAVGA